jgi:hypothetical protein
MTATYSLKLGSYSFPSTFHPSSVPVDSRLGSIEVPRYDGIAVGTAYLGAKTITVRGMLRAATPTLLRDAMDALLLAVNSGRQKLYVWDDRYIWANKTGLSTDYDETSFKRYCFVSIDFLCDSPFWESETESSDTWSSPTDATHQHITVGGNVYCLPVFYITAAASGTLDMALLQNATGDYFTLDGQVNAGDVIVVDCGEESVELQPSSADYMSMFDYEFFRLLPNAVNQISLTTSGVAITSIVTKWRNRWF